MAEKVSNLNNQEPAKLTTDFLGEDRHEFVAKLAYQLWEKRGHPIGSPEVDWFAAEQAVYVSLLRSNLITPLANGKQDLSTKIYSWR
jgi:Protein of unknown function (DUF2934)